MDQIHKVFYILLLITRAPELAAAIELLISEPSLRQKVAAEGYASFRKNFTWAVVKRQYEDVLASLPA